MREALEEVNYVKVLASSTQEICRCGFKDVNVPILRPGRTQVRSDKKTLQIPATVVPAHEMERYVQDFQQGGITGPLSYYGHARRQKEAGLPSKFPAHIPVLFFYDTLGGTCPQAYVTRMPEFISNLEAVSLQDKGHWLLLEATEQVNAEILALLDVKGDGGGRGLRAASIASVRF